jgi:hypothetical protein
LSKSGTRYGSGFIVTLLVLAAMVIFSSYSLYNAIVSAETSSGDASFSTLLGMIGLSVTAYLVMQLLRKPYTQKDPPKVVTTIECRKCGLKSVRAFVIGDHILKASEKCQKCDEPMLITGIYAEETKK